MKELYISGTESAGLIINKINTHLDYFVPGSETLHGSWTAGLDRGDEDADIVTPRQSDTNTSLLLEADKSWIWPARWQDRS